MHRSASAILAPIAHNAELNADAAALIEPNGATLSYREFWSLVEACHLRLEAAGITPGQVVAVLVPQGVLQVIAVTGAMSHGACAPLQPRTTVAEVNSVLRKLSASALIVSPEFEAESQTAAAMGLTVLVARAQQSPAEWEIHRSDSPASANSASRSEPSDAKLIFAASPTSGTLRLVPLSESNLEAGTAARRNSLRLTAADCLLLMTSLSQVASVENTFAQLQCGGTVIATGGFQPAAYLGWLNDLEPTWYACAPAVHQAALLRLTRDLREMPVSLRFIQSTGTPLVGEIRQRLEEILRIPIFNDYGMAEACPIASDAFLPGERVPGSAGRSLGMEIRIIGAAGEAAAAGVEGDITVRGPAVFSGYLDDPDATRAAFQDGWFRTGDIGHLDQDGNLFVTGRLSETINRGGETILLSEVDAVFASHPAVLAAAAFAVPHPTLGEDVACAVILRPSTESSLSAGELRRFAATQLARFKVPSRIYFVNEIPRGELGKPQRWVLAERLDSRRSASPSPAEMTKHANDVFFYRSYEIWARILDRDDLGFDENFFDAGGDSLAAVNMLAEVDQRFGSETSSMAASFFDEPTLAHLVELVGKPSLPRPSRSASSELRVLPIHDEGAPQRLFCIPADGDEGFYFQRLATHLRGQMDLSIIRPINSWLHQSLFTLEQAGAATAKLIREVQREGPYLVGGFCSGGVVAVEAARQLKREGADVRLVLFEVYMRAYPSLLRGWRTWVESARTQWRARGHAGNENFALNPGYVMKRLGWSAVTATRSILIPVEHVRAVQWFVRRILKDNPFFYKGRSIEVPILHFLCTDEANVINRESRFGWRAMARSGIEEQLLAFDHMNLFHETNLPKIAENLLRWSNGQHHIIAEPTIAQGSRTEVGAPRRKFLSMYLAQLQRVWRHLPTSARCWPAGRALGRHLDRIVRLTSNREQHFVTFFLRNRPELDLLRRIVEQRPKGSRLNMTILACSKGAEVYSIAWTIRSVRPDIDLRINAIDISPEIVEFARRGVYSMREPDDQDIPTEEAVRQAKDVGSIPSSDMYAWIFERLSQAEIDSMFELDGDEATVKPHLREGISWRSGDASDPDLPTALGPQDIVVANRFLCHMAPPEAETCLRNIGRLVKPGGHLFVYGLDLDVRTKIALEGGWTPVTDSIREIHEGDNSLRSAWPIYYWGLEPLDDTRPGWQLRYASVFQIGKALFETRELVGSEQDG